MFRSHSDHLQGACVFLIKVTDFKICQKCKKLVCGSITYGVCTCALFGEICRHTSPNRPHAHTPYVMLLHHHIDFFKNFKISDFNPLPVQFKALLHGQKGCVFFSVHLNLRTAPETGLPSREKNHNN